MTASPCDVPFGREAEHIASLCALAQYITVQEQVCSGTTSLARKGKHHFLQKLEIALKEASETGYWLELLHRTNYINDQQYKILSDKCTTIRVMLISSCRTAKENAK